MAQSAERKHLVRLLDELDAQMPLPFSDLREVAARLSGHGVYLIRDARGRVWHVGRTVSGKNGLAQRLGNHLAGKSSFARGCLGGNGKRLLKGFTFASINVRNPRTRTLLECAAAAYYCPKHIGTGQRAEV